MVVPSNWDLTLYCPDLNQVGCGFGLGSVRMKSESCYFMKANQNFLMVKSRAWISPKDICSVSLSLMNGILEPLPLSQTFGSFNVKSFSTLSIRRAWQLTSHVYLSNVCIWVNVDLGIITIGSVTALDGTETWLFYRTCLPAKLHCSRLDSNEIYATAMMSLALSACNCFGLY